MIIIKHLIMQGDFMKMPFPDNSFDAVYAIEATCHAPDAVSQFCGPFLNLLLHVCFSRCTGTHQIGNYCGPTFKWVKCLVNSDSAKSCL